MNRFMVVLLAIALTVSLMSIMFSFASCAIDECQHDLESAQAQVSELRTENDSLQNAIDVLESRPPCPECPECPECPIGASCDMNSLTGFGSEGQLKRWVSANMATEMLSDRISYAIAMVNHAIDDGYWMSMYLYRRSTCPLTYHMNCYTIAGEWGYMVNPMSGEITELDIVIKE